MAARAADDWHSLGEREDADLEGEWRPGGEDEKVLTEEADANGLPQSIAKELPPGWMPVQHQSGRLCYQHLQSKVMVQSRPYIVSLDEQFESHTPPAAFAAALELSGSQANDSGDLQRSATQQNETSAMARASAASTAAAAAAPQQPSACSMAGEHPVARVLCEGCGGMDIDVLIKTPVMILNEFAPKACACRGGAAARSPPLPSQRHPTDFDYDAFLFAHASNAATSVQTSSHATHFCVGRSLAVLWHVLDRGVDYSHS